MKLLSSFVFVVFAMGCSSQKIDSTIGPFKGDYQPYAQSWTGGIPGSGSGINLFLTLFDMDPEYIDAVYYKGMVTTTVDTVSDPKRYLVARFKTDFNQQPDINMTLDSKNEYGNKKPKNKERFPFDLEDDEAVLKIARNGKFTYVKIKGIQKKSAQDLPSRPQ
jgi:hypothetical protein